MIILTNTTDKVQVVLAGNVTTNQLPCFVSYRDTTSTTIEAKRNATNTNNTTVVDLVDSPLSSTQRIVDYISIHNADTATATVTVQFNDNSNLYILGIFILASGEKLEYQEGHGFKIISPSGAIRKDSIAGLATATSTMNFVYKSSDQSSTVTTFADISNLSFSVIAEKTYWFRFVIPYTVAIASTGARWAVNGPLSPRFLYYFTDSSATTSNKSYNRGISVYDGTVTSTSSATAGSNLAFIEGVIRPSANGTLIGRFASEVGGSAVTQKAGAFVQYIEI